MRPSPLQVKYQRNMALSMLLTVLLFGAIAVTLSLIPHLSSQQSPETNGRYNSGESLFKSDRVRVISRIPHFGFRWEPVPDDSACEAPLLLEAEGGENNLNGSMLFTLTPRSPIDTTTLWDRLLTGIVYYRIHRIKAI